MTTEPSPRRLRSEVEGTTESLPLLVQNYKRPPSPAMATREALLLTEDEETVLLESPDAVCVAVREAAQKSKSSVSNGTPIYAMF